MTWLTEPLTHPFFRYGLLAGVLGGALCGLVGVYVVLRRMSYIGHGLAHAIFGGAAIALILQWSYFLFAGAWGLLSALLIIGVSRRRKVGADAAIGVVTTASFAIGVVLISSPHAFEINLESLLFGSILGVTVDQLWVLAGVGLATLAVILLRYRQLLFATFDPEAADAYGVSSRGADALFAVIIAATVVATMLVLGVTLIAATIVVPAVIARLLTDSFARMLVISTLLGAIAGALGMYVSYYVDSPPGADIVLVLAGAFLIVFAGTALLSRRRLHVLGTVDPHAEAGAAIDLD